jgi:ankyrin repeat protein
MAKIHASKLKTKVVPTNSLILESQGINSSRNTHSIESLMASDSNATSRGTSLGARGNKDIEPLLLEAVRSNNFEYVDEYWHKVPQHLCKLVREAIVSASIDMLEHLLEACDNINNVDTHALNHAVKHNNIDIVQMLIKKGAVKWDNNSRQRHSDMSHAISNRSPEMIKLLLGLGCRDVADGFEKLLPSSGDAVATEAAEECFRILDGEFLITNQTHIDRCFRTNAEKSFNIPIAKLLLRNGADINKAGISGMGYSALYAAAGNVSLKAAEFMQFLLKSGAELPNMRGSLMPIEDRTGPRNISRWFGMEWANFVVQNTSKPSINAL